MASAVNARVVCGLCLLFVTPIFSLDLARLGRVRRDSSTDSSGKDERPAETASVKPKFSQGEFEGKLKDLLDRDRSERDDDQKKSPFQRNLGGFGRFFDTLDDLAERVPGDLSHFSVSRLLTSITRPDAQEGVRNNPCFTSPARLVSFFMDVHAAMRAMRVKGAASSQDSREQDDSSIVADVKDDVTDDKTDSSDDDVTNDTDSNGSDAPAVAGQQDSAEDLDDFDIEDIFEKLSKESLECLPAFFNDDEEKVLCRQLSQRSSHVFSVFIASGVDCSDYLEDDDDDDDDDDLLDLDDAHQKAILDVLLQNPTSNWTSGDLKRAIRIAPDVIDDDFFDDFNDDALKDSWELLGRLATRSDASVALQMALHRTLIRGWDLSALTAANIKTLGRGLLTLSEDELDDLDPEELLKANIDDLFDDKDDSSDDDDDRSGHRLVLGRLMRRAQMNGSAPVGRVVRFLYDDIDFLDSVDPDDLLESVSELAGLDLDDDDVANFFRRLALSSKFPPLAQFTLADLTRLQPVLPGLSLSQLKELPREALRAARNQLSSVHFGESQAREVLDELFDDDEVKGLTSSDIRGLGRLVRGLDSDDIDDIKDDAISDVLDDLDDLDLSDTQKRLFVHKALRVQNRAAHAKLLKLPGFASSFSVDDIDDLDDNDVIITLNVSMNIYWRATQAATIVSKVKQSVGGRGLLPSHIPILGKLSRGLLPSDLDDLLERDEDVDDVADMFSDLQDDLSSFQIDKILDRIEDNDHLDDLSEIKVTAAYVAQKGVFLAYLPPGQFNKLKFDDAAKKAFVTSLSKMDAHKLPRAQLTFMADKLMDFIEDKVDEVKDDADYRKLRLLGEFALGLDDDIIDKLSAKAVMQNLGTLALLPLTRDQAEEVLEKLEEAMPEWECKPAILASVGPLLQFAKEDTIESLCDDGLASAFSAIEKRLEKHREMVEERREEGLWREDSLEAPDTPDFLDDIFDLDDVVEGLTEDDDGRQKLASRMLRATLAVQAAKSGRRRRSVAPDYSTMMCSVLRLMRQELTMLNSSWVTAMPDLEFQNCLEFIGNGTKWTDKALGDLLVKAKRVIGEPSKWTNEMIRQAGVLVAALTPAEISNLQLSGVDALNSVARHARLSTEQLKAGFSRWLSQKKQGEITSVTTGEFSSISEFVCGLTLAQIDKLPINVFRKSLEVIGSAKTCSPDQRSAYVNKATQAYTSIVHNWSAAIVGDMGHLIGALPAPSIQQLTADHLALIRPAVIAQLPTASIKAMTDNQLRQLSTNQVNSMTPDQYSALSSAQQTVVDSKVTIPFKKPSKGTGGGTTDSVVTTTPPISSTKPDTGATASAAERAVLTTKPVETDSSVSVVYEPAESVTMTTTTTTTTTTTPPTSSATPLRLSTNNAMPSTAAIAATVRQPTTTAEAAADKVEGESMSNILPGQVTADVPRTTTLVQTSARKAVAMTTRATPADVSFSRDPHRPSVVSPSFPPHEPSSATSGSDADTTPSIATSGSDADTTRETYSSHMSVTSDGSPLPVTTAAPNPESNPHNIFKSRFSTFSSGSDSGGRATSWSLASLFAAALFSLLVLTR